MPIYRTVINFGNHLGCRLKYIEKQCLVWQNRCPLKGLENKEFISREHKLKFQAGKQCFFVLFFFLGGGGVGGWGAGRSGKGILWTRCIRNQTMILEIMEQSNLSQGKTGTGTWQRVTPHLESRASQSENLNKWTKRLQRIIFIVYLINYWSESIWVFTSQLQNVWITFYDEKQIFNFVLGDGGKNCVSDKTIYSKISIKVNRKVQEEPQAEVAATPTPGGREKLTQINTRTANKERHDKHKAQLPLTQARWSKC